MISHSSLDFSILQLAGNYGEDVERATGFLLADINDLSREELAERLAEIPEDAAPVTAMLVKLWTWIQAAKEAVRRNEETLKLCATRWPSTTGTTRPDKADSIGDSLDALIDELPEQGVTSTNKLPLQFGVTYGRSLKDLVKHVKENSTAAILDKQELLLRTWEAEGLSLTEGQRKFLLTKASPADAVLRTGRGFTRRATR
jgi:hypothetical protein